MSGPLVVVPCGGAKRDHRSPAGELYTGSYHRMCRRAAEALGARRILILSALHGLVELDTELDPYDLRMGQPGSVRVDEVVIQAGRLGELGAEDVIVLAGAAYATVAAGVWPSAGLPLAGTRGIGEQLSRLSAMARAAA